MERKNQLHSDAVFLEQLLKNKYNLKEEIKADTIVLTPYESIYKIVKKYDTNENLMKYIEMADYDNLSMREIYDKSEAHYLNFFNFTKEFLQNKA